MFASEPAKENVLFGAPNFVATPHLGASTNEAQENVALQVAEQMADYLMSGAVTNALNMPSISAEEAPRLKPFAALADKLGVFAGQIVDDGLDAVEIEYEGEVAKLNTRPLTSALLAGLMRPLLPDVNMVSAPAVLKEKGVPLTESKRETSPTYDSVIRIKVQTGGKWRTLAGAVVAGQPKLVEVKNMALEAPFMPVMLFINNTDKPGFIGRLGTLLGLIVETPSFNERVQQGGEIGYLTIALGVLAFVWGVFRWFTLSSTASAVKAQARRPKASKSNPLGRVMLAYEAVGNKNDVGAIQAALDDAILKELPKLESGLNLGKIISNVAPLLGLLGTVVGMVITFQSITLFGTGDPQIMASGISVALMTTVIGLVVSIPLVLLHAFASGAANRVAQMLEEQAAGIIAEHADGRR